MKIWQKADYKFLLIVLINLCLVTFYFYQKDDFHGDEIFSFAHANSQQGPYLAPGIDSFLEDTHHQLFGQSFSSDFFTSYITVSPEHRFDYENVVENLALGVHPPFYYFILHTISSFFPETFSKWQGYPINAVSLVLLLYFLYKIAGELFQDKRLCYLSLIFFSFSLANLNMAVFIRSYMLQAMLITWLIYEHLVLLKSNSLNFSMALKIFLLAFFGFLTHYYLLPVIFFISAGTCFIFLKRKQLRLIFIYAGLMLTCVAAFFLLYYPAADVLMHSYRGDEAADKDLDYYLLFSENSMMRIANLVLTSILPFNKIFCPAAVLVIFVLSVTFVKISPLRQTNPGSIFPVLLLYTLPYLVLIAFASPDMADFDDRYFMPVIPVLCLIIIYFADAFGKACGLSINWRFYILGVLIFSNVWLTDFSDRSNYAFHTSQEKAKIFADLSGKDVVFYNERIFAIINLVNDFRKVHSVTFVHDADKVQIISSLIKHKGDYFIVANSSATAFMKQKPSEPRKLDSKIRKHLHYIGTFLRGVYYYDIYRIKVKKGAGH